MMSGILSIHILTILSGLFNDIVWRRRVEQVWLDISEEQMDEWARNNTLGRNGTHQLNFVFLWKEEKTKVIFEVQDRTYTPKSCQKKRKREERVRNSLSQLIFPYFPYISQNYKQFK